MCSSATGSMGSVIGTDVGVVVLDDVHRRLFRRRPAAVDPGVARDQIFLLVRMSSLVLGHQATRAGIRSVVEQEPVDVLLRLVLVLVVVLGVLRQVIVDVEGSVRFLFCEQLVQGLARRLLVGRRPEPHPGRPPLRGNDPAVKWIVSRRALQRVSGVLYLVVLEVRGLVTSLVGHCSGPFSW